MLNRLVLLLSILMAFPLAGGAAHAQEVRVESRQITEFRNGSDERRFGSLEFIGGLEMYSPGRSLFGAWSGVRLRADGKNFVGILDTGHWMTGVLQRDAAGRLSGLGDIRIATMRDASGKTAPGKSRMDAEGLALRGDDILVSFEQRHRVDVYSGKDLATARPARSLALPFKAARLQANGGIEALAVAPQNTDLAGGAVVIAEKSLDQAGNHLAGILDGPLKGAFSVVRRDNFDITDSAFLPGGDLLVLQRRFSLATGVAMRIARIAGPAIRPGAVIEPEILLHAASGYQIDNMEGIEAFRGPDGNTRVIIVSDDNHSILQRNLMLEFRLLQ